MPADAGVVACARSVTQEPSGRWLAARRLGPPGAVRSLTCLGSALASTGLTALDIGIGEGRLPLRDELLEGLVDPLVDRRRLVLAEQPLPDRVGPLGGVETAVLLPLLEAVVVRRLGSVERVLEVRERVRRTEEVLAGPVRDDRVERLAVLGQVHALHEDRGHPALVDV